MALPPAAPDRQSRHHRSLDVQVFARGNGVWEVDARLSDIKSIDVELGTRIREAGTPVHEMMLRLVIDERFNILEAGSESVWMPYPGYCDDLDDTYARLVGLNLMREFRRGVAERVGGVRGCTHLTELCNVLPTAVVQAFANDVIDTHAAGPAGEPPFQIDRCHALRSDGPAVKLFYPRWHRGASDRNEEESRSLAK